MTRRQRRLWILPLVLALAAAAEPTSVARYTADGSLVLPADYREWVFLSTGLDMSYSEASAMAGHSMFDNVFVDRASWQRFKETGHWPDGAVFALELRGAATRGSINRRGTYQTDERMALEFHVHDEGRFKGGWAFFESDGVLPARQLPYSEACYSCHLQHGALDTTFTQFYPVAKAIATKAGTLRVP